MLCARLSATVMRSAPRLGDDRVERQIVRPGMEAREVALLEAHAERERAGAERRQRAVEVAAAIAQAMVGVVEAEHGDQEELGRGDVARGGLGNAVRTLGHRLARAPAAVLQRLALREDGGKREAAALGEELVRERERVELGVDRGVHADAAGVERREAGDDPPGDGARPGLMLRWRDLLAERQEAPALLLPPCRPRIRLRHGRGLYQIDPALLRR